MMKFTVLNKRVSPIAAALILLFSLLPAKLAHADANKLYVTPASSQMNLNTIFTLNVRSYADSDQTTGSATGSVTYPSGQLKVTGISVSGTDYSTPSITQGAGTIGFNASRNPAPSGSAQIFAVTFQAIGSGIAVVSFSNDSVVNGASTSYSSGSYTITNPNPTAPAPPAPKPSTAPKPTPVIIATTPTNTQDDNPQPTPDPTGLIDSVNVQPLYSSSDIVWSVHADGATSSLTYGENSTQLDKQAVVTKKADGTFATTVTGLKPGVRYFFTINANAPGGKSGTYSGVIPTRGFPVTITVTENKNPVQSGQIKIGSQSVPIPSGGKVTLGLAAGSYSGTITTDTASLNINLTVDTKNVPADGTTPENQSFSYNLSSSVLDQGPGSGFSILSFIGILFGGTVILGLSFVGFMAYRRRQFEQGSGGSSYGSSPTVIIDDGYDWKSRAEASSEATSYPAPEAPAVPAGLPHHHNSVYLSEEEPLDMFDAVAQNPPQTLHPPQTPNSNGSPVIQQSPNSQHSTTP